MEIKNKELLAKIADYLETLPDEKFDIFLFCDPEGECGTAGCIFGHAVLNGMIPECRYDPQDNYQYVSPHLNEWTTIESFFGKEARPIFDGFSENYKKCENFRLRAIEVLREFSK